jgi:hypothetical protein
MLTLPSQGAHDRRVIFDRRRGKQAYCASLVIFQLPTRYALVILSWYSKGSIITSI